MLCMKTQNEQYWLNTQIFWRTMNWTHPRTFPERDSENCWLLWKVLILMVNGSHECWQIPHNSPCEKSWKAHKTAQKVPWIDGPLYLARGDEKISLGWNHLEINVQGNIINLPVAVLAPNALGYGIALGLVYLILSTMQINVTDRMYSFKSEPSVFYLFQPGGARIPEMSFCEQKLNH